MTVLQLKNVYKSFGKLQVIKDLSFSVEDRTVFGFIGKNGAGKTTTMKMILGFLQPDGGEIYVCGERVIYGNTSTNRHVGYLPDVPEFYGYMSPMEYLKLCGEISGLPRETVLARSKELLCLVGLEGINRRIRGFSRGMKQRLGIAQALLNEPKLLICDEPTSALDPIGRKEILDILSVAKQKTTIVFSTHILSDVERIADSIGLIDEGKLMLEGPVHKIKDMKRKDIIKIQLSGTERINGLAERLKELPFVLGVHIENDSIFVNLTGAQEHGGMIMSLLVTENVPVLRYEIQEPSLENVFLEVVG